MDKVDKALNRSVRQIESLSQTESTQSQGDSLTKKMTGSQKSQDLKTLTERHIAKLWAHMPKLYGHKWNSSYGELDVDNVWLNCLQGLRTDQLRAGLSVLARNGEAWPPSAPEFRKICEEATSPANGLADATTAFLEACRNAGNPTRAKWSHPAVFVAGRETGWFDLKHWDPQEKGSENLKARFKRNYEIMLRRVADGEELGDEIPIGIEDTRGKKRALTERDKKAGQQHLKNLKDLL